LKATKINGGHSIYNELYDLNEIQLSSTEEEDFTEFQENYHSSLHFYIDQRFNYLLIPNLF